MVDHQKYNSFLGHPQVSPLKMERKRSTMKVRTMQKGILLSILDTGRHLISVMKELIDIVLKKQPVLFQNTCSNQHGVMWGKHYVRRAKKVAG